MSEQKEARLPRLRLDLEYIPISYQGRRALLIRDPLDIIKEPVLLQGEAVELLGLIDGRREIQEIQAGMMRLRNGLFISAESISRLLDELEKAFILESGQLQHKRARLVQEYAALEVRPASHAGRSYPADRRALEKLLDQILTHSLPPGRTPGRMRALVAPHIDLQAGKRAYGRIYGLLRETPPPRTVLLLGTGHSLGPEYFSLTEKDFETPLGLVKTDRESVRCLASRAGRAAEANDFGHRGEHSLEIQLIFLQHIFGSGFRLIPVLCGSFQDHLAEAGRASDIPAVAPMLDSLGELLNKEGDEVLAVAGVDFSHVGPKFGHDRSAASMMAETRRHDERLIEALCRRDVSAFWLEVRQVKDTYNVCGFSSLACLLEALPPNWPGGQPIDYDIWREEATRSAVSFASIAFI
ncbi:MAG TPA: AmmeMemoRadiSam system protein B [Acidobacteriota bacterium]